MASAAPLFFDDVTKFVSLALLVVFLVIEIVAFVNCLTQRADAFPVVGSVLLTLVCGFPGSFVSIFGFAAITAAAIYMLDVRPALRDATDGTGNW
jgi:hypothetical protein